jgi:hypothetical protein
LFFLLLFYFFDLAFYYLFSYLFIFLSSFVFPLHFSSCGFISNLSRPVRDETTSPLPHTTHAYYGVIDDFVVNAFFFLYGECIFQSNGYDDLVSTGRETKDWPRPVCRLLRRGFLGSLASSSSLSASPVSVSSRPASAMIAVLSWKKKSIQFCWKSTCLQFFTVFKVLDCCQPMPKENWNTVYMSFLLAPSFVAESTWSLCMVGYSDPLKNHALNMSTTKHVRKALSLRLHVFVWFV